MPDDHQYRGWVRPGPRPPGGLEPEEGDTPDYSSGYYSIFQFSKGHRFSTDDILAAWYGTTWCPTAQTALDLGSGIGTVGMIVAWRFHGTKLVTVEAQEQSVTLERARLPSSN